MSKLSSMFALVQPLSLEMLDDKADITKHLTPSVVASIEKDMHDIIESFRAIAAKKKKLGAFSTREQNIDINAARKKHEKLAPTLKWFIARCVIPFARRSLKIFANSALRNSAGSQSSTATSGPWATRMQRCSTS